MASTILLATVVIISISFGVRILFFVVSDTKKPSRLFLFFVTIFFGFIAAIKLEACLADWNFGE